MHAVLFILAGLAMAGPQVLRRLNFGGAGGASSTTPPHDAGDFSHVPVTIVIEDIPTGDTPPPLSALHGEDVSYLARTLYGEAVGESEEGILAVAHVILNRVRSGQFPNTIKDVVLQYRQFSMWNDGGARFLALTEADPHYRRLLDIARRVLRGETSDPTGGLYDYANETTVASYSGGVIPASHWIRQATSTLKIGRHTFYELPWRRYG